MPDPELPSPIQPNPSKSYTHFFRKSFVSLLVLVILLFFPSEAPEFIKQSCLTRLWELLRLLFIGIAVSYGLFSRRNAQINIDDTNANISSRGINFSGVSQISSMFQDGYETSCGSDEKGMNQASFFENPYEKRAKQTWNSQNVQGKSRVIVGDGNNAPDQLGKPKSDIDHRPLGLPVRSLRSRIVDGDTTETIDLSASSSRLKACSNFGDEVKIGKFRGLVPINLEKKFEETLEPSRIPRGSRSGRMEMRDMLGNVKPSSYCRPLLAGEFELECGKSQSFRSSVSSHTSAKHSLWKMPDSKLEDVNRKKTSDGSILPPKQRSLAPLDGDASTARKNTRGSSVGSSYEMNVPRGFKDSLTAFDKSKTGEALSRGMLGVDSLNSDLKPATLPNGLSRGKSVRTIRSSEQFFKGRKSGKVGIDHIDDEVGLRCEKLKGDSDENSMRRAGLRNLQARRRKGIDNLLSRANSTFLKHQNAGKQDFTDSDIESEEGSERGKQDFADSDIESEEGSERELDNFHVSSNEEETGCRIVSGSESESDEVDRKASEFIAKFREQIRLQKISDGRGKERGQYKSAIFN
ncbi:hypothetical protein RJ640_023610 [Escallonia rubra]|uniref:Uncharacterized protein n=1 Tax=Escallonia rubra TaxID=112253 RepID=A0AA88Q967_9ASTE|nr:hypothetical protein RJ640_023610 [Escallonia rubra]